jgi:hypothetical protein
MSTNNFIFSIMHLPPAADYQMLEVAILRHSDAGTLAAAYNCDHCDFDGFSSSQKLLWAHHIP